MKIQRKGYMAKEMIKLGVSENIEEALSQIEGCNLVCTNDGFSVAQNSPAAVLKAKQKWRPVENTPGNSRRLDKMEEKLEFILEFVNKYARQNDDNLKEVDLHLRMMKHDLEGMRTNSKDMLKAESLEKAEQINQDDIQMSKVLDNGTMLIQNS